MNSLWGLILLIAAVFLIVAILDVAERYAVWKRSGKGKFRIWG